MSNFSQLALLVAVPVMIRIMPSHVMPAVPVHPVAAVPQATAVPAKAAEAETGICLCHKASALYDKGDFQQAATYYRKAELKMAQEYGANSSDVALMQYDQANCFYELSNYKVAENMYSKSLSTYGKVGNTDHKDIADVEWGLGNVHTVTKSYDKAIVAYNAAISNFKAVGPSKDYAECLRAFADCYRNRGMQQKANELAAQAKEMDRRATS